LRCIRLSGYGAVFGNVDSYGDVIQKGAFNETLRRSKRGLLISVDIFIGYRSPFTP
jgi:phage head maturation protease